MQDTKIEWATHSFNPWHGCFKVSPGCTHCYAETFSRRLGRDIWGPPKTTARMGMSDNYWRQPLKWNKAAAAAGQRARVFCASMADVFEEHPQIDDNEWRNQLWDLIEQTDSLDWLLLTKRPENVIGHRLGPMVPNDWLYEHVGFPSNVWIGTSVENQEYADKRIPELLKIPARVRFLSCEPLLGPIDLGRACPCGYYCDEDVGHVDHGFWTPGIQPGIHWVIVGGESGHGARPMHPDWARSLRDQCERAGVAYFFKQWGEWGLTAPINDPLATQIEPALQRLGKHAAGRLLDGRIWDELPR